MYSKIIDAYIRQHQSGYQAKYCYHSCDREDEKVFKFHYYVRDPQLLQIDIFLEIYLDQEVHVKVLEDLHQQECDAIAIDALNRVRSYTNRKTTISPKKMSDFIKSPVIRESLTAQDMINILNHIEFKKGKNADSIYEFYSIYLKYYEMLIRHQRYHDMALSLELLFDEILYEVEWVGINTKYLDQEHFMHQAYIRTLVNMMNPYLDDLIREAPERMARILVKVSDSWRFSFSIYSSIEELILAHPNAGKQIIQTIDSYKEKIDVGQTQLVFRNLRAINNHDDLLYRHTVKEILKLLIKDIIEIVNHEDQEQVGLIFLQQQGFDLLIEIFDETRDASIYKCFPITQIPQSLHSKIKLQLENALKYYANNMQDPNMRLDCLSQIATINTLLIENF